MKTQLSIASLALPLLTVLAIGLLMVLGSTLRAQPGTVQSHQKISDTEGGFTGTLDDEDIFGASVAALGDLDGDGVEDIAVGAAWDDDGGVNRGAVWVLFLNTDGTVKSHQKISDTAGGFTGTLNNGDVFGFSVAALGDLDGDGIQDIAVGAVLDDDGGDGRGAVWVLFLNTDGTVSSHQKISDTAGGFTGTLDDFDLFGTSVVGIGDLDGDGTQDIAVGADGDDDGGVGRGAVWILFLNTNGTVKSHQKISDTEGGFTGNLDDFDEFGVSVAGIGDLDADGVQDIVVGADDDDDGGSFRGAVWILFLNTNGTVKSHQKISDTAGGFTGTLDDFDEFGRSVAGVGDLDGDGTEDIAVGAWLHHDGGPDRGAVWLLFLNTNGTVKSHQKISDTAGGFTGNLDDEDLFGFSVAGLGDLDGDGKRDIAVGADFDDDGGSDRGAVWVLFLDGMVVPVESGPADTPGTHVLEAAYPNPFNPEATFRFAAYEQQNVRAVLVDVMGRVVATLFEGDVAAGEMQTVRIDGAGLPSGTYAVRLIGETFSDALTVTLLK